MHTARETWTVLTIATAAVLTSATVAQVMPSSPPPPSYLVGAYYYGWYDAEHRAALDYLGPHLPEPLEPSLGEYRSEDPAVVAAHVEWASRFGIDFLIVSWSGQGRTSDRQARNLLMPALAESPVRQAPVIETLAYSEELAYRDLDLSNPAFRHRLTADVLYLGEHYLRHPSAMRIYGRPLLFVYVTRVLRGDIIGWLREVRRDLAAVGIDPFIVADEAFWQPSDPGRLRAFDAITTYNVYDWPLTQHRGWASESTFFEDVERLFARWRDAAGAAGIAFVPNIMPGFNDRGVRLEEDHYVIPRQARPGGRKTGFFERSIELATRYTDPELRMVTITSFNEWHEWTQIEPARPAWGRRPERFPFAYTQGFPHPRYDFEYLDLVRERLGPAGSQRSGAPVSTPRVSR